MRRFAAVLFAAATMLMTVIASGGDASAAPGCAINLTAPPVIAAVKQLPPYPGPVGDWKWSTRPLEGNYNTCAPLTTALVTIEGATGSSLVTALMFHDGNYLGTATSKAYGLTSFNAARTTGDTVVLDYKQPGACTACEPAGVTSVRYQWQGDHVAMLDPPPPPLG